MKKFETLDSPKTANRFLSWFCKDDLLEEVKGDLYEFYLTERKEKSKFQANLVYWYHVLNFLRPFAFRRKTQKFKTSVMYRSYLKTGLRNFKKNKLSSFINVFGLATTIAIALIVYVLVDRQFTLDNFHSEGEKIFAVQSTIEWSGSEETWGKAPLLLGPSLQSDIPQVDQMTRVNVKPAIVRYDDKVFTERLTFADAEYLTIFEFPLTLGTNDGLKEKSNVILSDAMAKKYFPNQDPIGEDLKVIVNEKSYLFTVAGIAAPFPVNASFSFNFLLAFNNLESIYGTGLNGWNNVQTESVFTFVKLDDQEHRELVTGGLGSYVAVVNSLNKDWPIRGFKLHELTTLARNAQYVKDTYASGSTPEIIIMFGIISLLLLISACFNYVNISVSMAQKRLTEIALRKVVGGQRRQLVAQFLTENMVLCFAATILGVFLAKYVLLGGINKLFLESDYSINFFQNPALGFFLFGLFVLLSLASGAYPALYISSFKPVSILKGKEKLISKNKLSKVFLTTQFFLTFIAIVSGFLFTNVNKAQEQQDWGYQPDDLLVLPVANKEQYDAIRLIAEQSPRIVASSGSKSQIGLSGKSQVVRILEDKYTVKTFAVGNEYVETLGFHLNSGRDFDPNLKSDVSGSILVNEQFIKKLGIKNADLEIVEMGGADYKIIGILEDYHFEDFFSPITPSIFHIATDDEFNYISMKTIGDGTAETEAIFEEKWGAMFPDTPYAGFFQEDVFDGFFRSTGVLNSIMNFVALVAIVLSSMGLFGLVSLLIVKKLKEYSIRKVLGAQSFQVVKLILGQFLGLMVIALLVGIPASYFLFNVLFEQMFPGTIDAMSFTPFISAILILLTVILITITSHIFQLLRMNPVNSLRLEN